MQTDVQYILAAYQGRIAMLNALFGSSTPEVPKKKKPTADAIKSFAKTHNALMAAGKIRKR